MMKLSHRDNRKSERGAVLAMSAISTLSSRATVSITNFEFQFSIPLLGGTMTLPAYRTSLPGESVGYVPCDVPAGNPLAPCNIIPN